MSYPSVEVLTAGLEVPPAVASQLHYLLTCSPKLRRFLMGGLGLWAQGASTLLFSLAGAGNFSSKQDFLHSRL